MKEACVRKVGAEGVLVMVKKVAYSEAVCLYVITGFMVSTAALFAYIGHTNILLSF
jgi:hypothetical protein